MMHLNQFHVDFGRHLARKCLFCIGHTQFFCLDELQMSDVLLDSGTPSPLQDLRPSGNLAYLSPRAPQDPEVKATHRSQRHMPSQNRPVLFDLLLKVGSFAGQTSQFSR
jgi:hypothetical protein